MGLAQVVYSGTEYPDQNDPDFAQTLGISPEEAVEGISLILDTWRRNRLLYVMGDPVRFTIEGRSLSPDGAAALAHSDRKGCCSTPMPRTTTLAA